MGPISAELHRQRAQATPPLVANDPILLTRVKPPSAEQRGPKRPAPASLVEAVSQLEVPGRSAGRLEVIEPAGRPVTQLRVSAVGCGSVALDRPKPSTAPPPAVGGLAQTTDANTRRHRRFPLKVEVSYDSEHNFFTGFMQNIGEGGLFVATHQPVPLGDIVEVTFSVAGLERVCTALCRVRWIREDNPGSPDSVPGMGLQFAELDPDVRAAIELFIEHREPIFYDD